MFSVSYLFAYFNDKLIAQSIIDAIDDSGYLSESIESIFESLKNTIFNIELEDVDYGIWFIDAYEHPERYVGKELSFLAQIMRPQNMPNNMIVAGRQIMTCCADDIGIYGYPCKMMKKEENEGLSN